MTEPGKAIDGNSNINTVCASLRLLREALAGGSVAGAGVLTDAIELIVRQHKQITELQLTEKMYNETRAAFREIGYAYLPNAVSKLAEVKKEEDWRLENSRKIDASFELIKRG